MRRSLPVLASTLASTLMLAACGLVTVEPTGGEPSPPTDTEVIATPTSIEAPDEGADQPPVVDEPPPEPNEQSPTIITPTVSTGEQRFTLADAFSAEGWREGEFTPAGRSQAVPAMQTPVNCYDNRVIELRFAQPTGRLDVDVSQAMDAPSSNERVEFSLRTDGRQADSKTIPFTGVATLTTELSGVTVVTISAQAAPDTADYRCSGDTSALITRIAIVR